MARPTSSASPVRARAARRSASLSCTIAPSKINQKSVPTCGSRGYLRLNYVTDKAVESLEKSQFCTNILFVIYGDRKSSLYHPLTANHVCVRNRAGPQRLCSEHNSAVGLRLGDWYDHGRTSFPRWASSRCNAEHWRSAV